MLSEHIFIHMYIRPIILLLIFAGLLLGYWPDSHCFAQSDYDTRVFTREDGLPYNHILNITQDQTGFLWISSWDGLSRFDGYEFKNYHHRPDDSTSIPYFIVNKVLVDYTNTVWVLCVQRPLVRYNRQKDSFEQFRLKGLPKIVPSDIVLSFDTKSILITDGNSARLHIYNTVNKSVSTVHLKDENGGYFAFTPHRYPLSSLDNEGNTWFFHFNPEGFSIMKGNWYNDTIIRIKQLNPLDIREFKSSMVHDGYEYFNVFISGSGTTWLFTKYGLFRLNVVRNQFEKYTGPIHPEEFTGKPYFFWFDDETGAHWIDTNERELKNMPGLPGIYFESFFIDRSHTVWYSTVSESRGNMGLVRRAETPSWFRHYLTGMDESGQLHLVFPLVKDENGDIWAGTRGTDQILRIRPDGKIIKTEFWEPVVGYKHPKVRSMCSDSSGIWMGCTDNRLFHFEYETGKFRQWNLLWNDAEGIGKNINIHNIHRGKNEILINGTAIFSFNPFSGVLQLKYTLPEDLSGFSFLMEKDRGFWIGANNNTVIRLDSSLNKANIYTIGKGSNHSEHICPGDSNDVWVAWMGGGLGHLDYETGKSEILTTADGLANNTVYSILKDKKGNLWISTNQGISRFNPVTRHFRNFGKAEGLLIEEFNSDSYFQASDGEMFFGGVGGLVSFYPDSIAEKNEMQEPPLVITDFKVSGLVRIFEKAVYDLDSLTLTKGDNNFQVAFASLDLKNGNKIKYRYRLIGANELWTETDHRNRRISYTNLLPGNYRLEMEATNPAGEWASHTVLNIKIPFRYYETLGFRLFVIIVILSVFVLIVFMYIRQLRLKAMQKQDELTLESLRGQMNPHFIFNSLNSINYFILRNDKIAANHYIADFSRLIRSILSNMAEDYIPFDRELESISDYLKLEHLRFGDRFDYFVDTSQMEEISGIWVVPGLVQPFIENAIWHGIRNLENRKGIIIVRFTEPEKNGFIRCYVEDSGVGRKMSALYKSELPGKKSRGIGIVNERLKLINNIRNSNYQIRIEDLYIDQAESGTRVIIDIPVKI